MTTQKREDVKVLSEEEISSTYKNLSREAIVRGFVARIHHLQAQLKTVAEQARKEEREACAVTCEKIYGDTRYIFADIPSPEDCAESIRNRSKEPQLLDEMKGER